MRKLLVVSQENLPANILSALELKHWSVAYARELDKLDALAAEESFLVGLVVFPNSRDTRHESYLRQRVETLTGIKWVAALTEEQLGHADIKRFIAERLYDFHVFPLDAERIATVLGHAYGMARIEREMAIAPGMSSPNRFGLVGESPVMRALHRMLQRAAESEVSVLITGPTGTGKELAARAIHDHSARAKGPYVAINCAAIPPSLLQSELFGHEKGSFTSANTRKHGYIQSAAGGTLFLDEIGDMPMESQATLLRFLEDKIVTPIGSTRGKRVDVRIIASTNVDLERSIRDRTFRADLYYRLAFLTIQTPELRERGNDIELLANHFLKEVTADAGTRDLRLDPEALTILRGYAWPGNVRELRSVIFQAAMSCEGVSIRPDDLKVQINGRHAPEEADERRQAPPHQAPPLQTFNDPPPYHHHAQGTLKNAREQSEKRNLEYALARNASNITRAAQDLGVSRMTLYRLMSKHGVTRASAD